MKVLHLISSTGFFGAENMVLELARQSTAGRYMPTIAVLSHPKAEVESFIKPIRRAKIPLAVIPVSGKLDLKAIRVVRKLIVTEGMDIIHSHNYKSDIFGFLATLGLDVIRVATCHNWSLNSGKMRLYQKLDVFFLRFFNLIIAVSEQILMTLRHAGVAAYKSRLIVNGIDYLNLDSRRSHAELPPKFKKSTDTIIIGTVGRLTPEKDPMLLINAFRRISSKYPGLTLVFAGDGPFRETMEREIFRSDLQNKVLLLGIRDDVPDLLEEIDIFVMSSRDEGSPIALLEAMACSKPVIATRVGMIPAIIEEGRSGLLIPPGDAERLIEALETLIANPQKRAAVGRSARKRIEENFSSKIMADTYFRSYRTACSLRSHKGPRLAMIEIAGKGGICHYTYNLLHNLLDRMPAVLLTSANYELSDKNRDFLIVGTFDRFKTNPLRIIQMIRMIARYHISIVHVQLSQYPSFALSIILLIQRFTNASVVITAHNALSHEKSMLSSRVHTAIYKAADAIIVHGVSCKDSIITSHGIPGERIQVIPHGNYLFFNAATQPSKIDTKKKNVLFFGYIRRYKGLEYLIRASQKAAEQIPEFHLTIVGKPVEDFAYYRSLINELGIEDRSTTRLDYVPIDEVSRYFNDCTIVVLPYINIYQSGILQLAYAFGRPVIASRIGGLAEAVRDEENGLLVPPGQVQPLADAMIRLLKDTQLQQRMGDRSRLLAETEFSWASIAERTERVYSRLMQIPAAPVVKRGSS